jgi:hypothetical protein
MWVLHITGVTETTRRVERNQNSWTEQYKKERHIHNLDKWTIPQERKNLKIKIKIILRTKF